MQLRVWLALESSRVARDDNNKREESRGEGKRREASEISELVATVKEGATIGYHGMIFPRFNGKLRGPDFKGTHKCNGHCTCTLTNSAMVPMAD